MTLKYTCLNRKSKHMREKRIKKNMMLIGSKSCKIWGVRNTISDKFVEGQMYSCGNLKAKDC